MKQLTQILELRSTKKKAETEEPIKLFGDLKEMDYIYYYDSYKSRQCIECYYFSEIQKVDDQCFLYYYRNPKQKGVISTGWVVDDNIEELSIDTKSFFSGGVATNKEELIKKFNIKNPKIIISK